MDKPELQYRQRPGQHGEIVVELTPQSEQLWSDYLREQTIGRLAINQGE